LRSVRELVGSREAKVAVGAGYSMLSMEMVASPSRTT
jgi:hypothetical protein